MEGATFWTSRGDAGCSSESMPLLMQGFAQEETLPEGSSAAASFESIAAHDAKAAEALRKLKGKAQRAGDSLIKTISLISSTLLKMKAAKKLQSKDLARLKGRAEALA
eukprot:6478737-Amphidinium_carterae.1